jgi:hypothetical protein
MNAPEAIIITIAVIVGIILVMAFHEAIAGLLVWSSILVMLLVIVSGVVGGIIMMVRAVQANDVGLGVAGAIVTCVSMILIYLAGLFLYGAFMER